MQYGVCCSPEHAAAAAAAGYDYFEWSVQAFLQPRSDEASFEAALKEVRAAPLPSPVLNMFLPGDLKVVGPVVDRAAGEEYVAVACRRAEVAGVDMIVFGSGGARGVPEGFERAKAKEQIVELLELTAPYAAKHGVTIVIEPLRLAECNLMNTVAECAPYVRGAESDAIQLLVDGYHWAYNEESVEDITEAAELFRHVHVATKPNRLPPGAEPCEATDRFLAAIKEIGYRGRLSVEGPVVEAMPAWPAALRLMRELLGG